MGYSTSCSLCIASLQYGWKEVLAQKIEKASGFLCWKDKGMQLSKRLLGKRCIMKHHPSLGLLRTADALQRPPLIPPAQKSAPDNMQDIQTHCNRENVFQVSSNEEYLDPRDSVNQSPDGPQTICYNFKTLL